MTLLFSELGQKVHLLNVLKIYPEGQEPKTSAMTRPSAEENRCRRGPSEMMITGTLIE